MAYSTGVSLLTSGGMLLRDQLAEFWEFTSGTGTGYLSGTSTGDGVGLSIVTGVNGAANDALQVDSSWNPFRSWLNVGSPYRTVGGTQTYCFFCSAGGNPFALRWGSILGGTSGSDTLGILFSLDTGTLFRLTEGGTYSSIQSALASAYTSANNGYRFYCITREGVGGSINTFSFYDSSGELIGQRSINATGANTINFGVLEYSLAGPDTTVKMDKVAWFNDRLDPSQIAYLYNSGNGRSATEIMTATL